MIQEMMNHVKPIALTDGHSEGICRIRTPMSRLPGKARVPQNEFLPWLLSADSELVVHQTGDQQKVMALAQVYCQLASKFGVMNISLVDYSVQQKVDGNGDAMNFRYDITPKTKVNCFLPKALHPLTCSTSRHLPSALFGAIILENCPARCMPRSFGKCLILKLVQMVSLPSFFWGQACARKLRTHILLHVHKEVQLHL